MAIKKLRRVLVCVSVCCTALGTSAFSPSLVRPVYAQAAVQMPDVGISFVPPAGYRRSTALGTAVFRYTGPAMNGMTCGFNLAKNPAIPGEKINAATAERMVGVLQKLYPSYKKVAAGTLTVAGERAAFLSGVLSTAAGKRLQTKQVFLVHKGQVYNFTFSAEPQAFPKQVGAFDKMVASLKWL